MHDNHVPKRPSVGACLWGSAHLSSLAKPLGLFYFIFAAALWEGSHLQSTKSNWQWWKHYLPYQQRGYATWNALLPSRSFRVEATCTPTHPSKNLLFFFISTWDCKRTWVIIDVGRSFTCLAALRSATINRRTHSQYFVIELITSSTVAKMTKC